MKLSKVQVDFVNVEKRHYEEMISAKERQGLYTGIGYDRSQLQMLRMIIRLHNLEVNSETKSKDPQPAMGLSEGLC